MKDLIIDVLDRPEHKDGLSSSEIESVIKKESLHPESHWDFPVRVELRNVLFQLTKKEIIVRVSTRKYKMPLFSKDEI